MKRKGEEERGKTTKDKEEFLFLFIDFEIFIIDFHTSHESFPLLEKIKFQPNVIYVTGLRNAHMRDHFIRTFQTNCALHISKNFGHKLS